MFLKELNNNNRNILWYPFKSDGYVFFYLLAYVHVVFVIDVASKVILIYFGNLENSTRFFND
jgi:hypothetical protein